MDSFEQRYATGDTPWDIGRAQSAFVALETAGRIEGAVLDVGCGSGDLVLYLAAKGHTVHGIDGSHRAIAAARDKARARGLERLATFRVHDALALGALGRRWKTLVDGGLFHVFDDADRVRYVAGLADAIEPGGCYHVLCFSDAEPGTEGPRRVAADELRAAFATGWSVEALDAVDFERVERMGPAKGWRASVRRVG